MVERRSRGRKRVAVGLGEEVCCGRGQRSADWARAGGGGDDSRGRLFVVERRGGRVELSRRVGRASDGRVKGGESRLRWLRGGQRLRTKEGHAAKKQAGAAGGGGGVADGRRGSGARRRGRNSWASRTGRGRGGELGVGVGREGVDDGGVVEREEESGRGAAGQQVEGRDEMGTGPDRPSRMGWDVASNSMGPGQMRPGVCTSPRRASGGLCLLQRQWTAHAGSGRSRRMPSIDYIGLLLLYCSALLCSALPGPSLLLSSLCLPSRRCRNRGPGALQPKPSTAQDQGA